MDLDWESVEHVTKVDPAKSLPDDLSVLEGTDLILVGGSDGVTEENTLRTVETVGAAVPETAIWQEPYRSSQVSRKTIEAVDSLSIPAVYNGDRDNFVGKHVDLFTEVSRKPDELAAANLPVLGDAITSKVREVIADLSTKIVGEGYVVQHLESAAADRAGVRERYSPEQVAGAALATETFYGFPVFYVEYSGTYGGPADVEAATPYLEDTVLFYGGGIDGRERAREILAAGADAIVVGDCFHDDVEAYLETIP